MKKAAIILAAGRGERIGSPENGPKQYRSIAGQALICYTLRRFLDSQLFSTIVLVIHKDDEKLCRDAIGDLANRVLIVFGGNTRQISTLCGLRALNLLKSCSLPDYVYIHDGARPFVSLELLERIDETLDKDLCRDYGILPAIAVSDTLKCVNEDNMVIQTIPRQHLYAAQTPQAFPFQSIFNAHEKAEKLGLHEFTDDSALAEWAGLNIKIVKGDSANIKITWPADLVLARLRILEGDMTDKQNQTFFPDIRTGNGYDVHSFEPGDHVTLCGVNIAHDKKLNGHSDADVALHALTDALLATRSAGDIGTHFPPSDPQWKGASSDIFVRHAVAIIKSAGGRIANADITLIAESPKIGCHRRAMIEKLMDMLGISADRISIKATTNEKLGFIGRQEGIAAIATATVIYPGNVPE